VKRNPNKKGNTVQHQAPLTTASPPLASASSRADVCLACLMSSVLDVPWFPYNVHSDVSMNLNVQFVVHLLKCLVL